MVWGLKPLSKILRNFKTFSAVESNMNISYFLAFFSQHVQVSLVFHSIQLTFYLPENLRFMGSNPLRAWKFFRYYFNYWFSSVYSCEDLLYSFLHRSAHTWFSYIYKLKIPFFKRQLICNLLFFVHYRKVQALSTYVADHRECLGAGLGQTQMNLTLQTSKRTMRKSNSKFYN